MRKLPADCGAALRYVALGDSTAAGEGATTPENTYPSHVARRLRRVYPRTQLRNLASGGAVAGDVARLQLGQAVALQPQLVTLSIGPNDVNQGHSAGSYGSTVRVVLDRLAHATEAVLVVNLMPDMSLATAYSESEKVRIRALTVEFNQALEAAADAFDVELVDLYAPSRALGSDYEELLSADGFHPSDLGYLRWAEFMWFGIERRLGCTEAAATTT